MIKVKKIISIIISIAICFCTFGISTLADAVIFGDLNNDSEIDNKDYAILMQYLNGWNVDINVSASDVNIDNSVDNRDYALLMQYLNGWDIKLGEKQQDSNTVNPEDYRGTSITFATTILSAYNEAGPVIYNFEKEYGIEVNEILVTDNMSEVGSKIAAGINVDVVKCNGDFPAVLSVLQPLTKAKLDYNDLLWDKNIFEFSTFNGEPYLCNTKSNIWTENACVLYSKSMLDRANCPTPEMYDSVGKWTWEAFFEIAKHVDLLDGVIGSNSEIQGCYISVEDMLGSVGCGVYNYEDGKFSNGLKNNFHKEAMLKLAGYYRQSSTTSSATYDTIKTLYDGKVGIAVGNIQMLKKCDLNTKTYNWSDLGFYSMPSYDAGYQACDTSRVVGWGICKGSENPVGAGIFLRYYLDIGNYDVGGSFINSDAEIFFFKESNIDYKNYTPYFTYEYSNNNISSFWDYDWEELSRYPEEIYNTKYPEVSANVDKACDNLNDFIESYVK